jgi:recombinational DNA repair ATPase RecF
MVVSQLQLLRVQLGINATLLLDDPAAELDATNLSLMMKEISDLKCQLIATSLSPETALFQAPKSVFHVEQGRVLRV